MPYSSGKETLENGKRVEIFLPIMGLNFLLKSSII